MDDINDVRKRLASESIRILGERFFIRGGGEFRMIHKTASNEPVGVADKVYSGETSIEDSMLFDEGSEVIRAETDVVYVVAVKMDAINFRVPVTLQTTDYPS